MADLTTTSQVKSFLNIKSTQQDNWLDALRQAAEADVKEYLGRDLSSNRYVEYYSGNSQRGLVLRQRPVTQIHDVWLDFQAAFGQANTDYTPFPDSAKLVQGVDYALDYDAMPGGAGGTVTSSRSGVLWRLRTIWAEVPREYYPGKLSAEIGPTFGVVKVDYTAGLVSIPMDLQYVVAYLVAYMKRTAPYGADVGEERVGDYSYAIHNLRVPEPHPELTSARQILNRYREVNF